MGQIAKLIMVTAINNNKYYDMEEAGGQIKVKYGRVGVTEQHATYPISKWNSLLKSKLRKGYKNVTELRCEPIATNFQIISSDAISAIVAELQAYAKGSISKNYTVSSDAVTQKQIDEAQQLLDLLANTASKKRINYNQFDHILLDLFQVIPRRMGNVQDHLLRPPHGKAATHDDATKIVATEQVTLDVMKGQVRVNTVQKAQKVDDKKNILQAMGLDIAEVTPEDIKIIKTELGGMKDKYHRAFKVINKRTQKKFDEFVKKTKNKKCRLFWHGSRNENWWSILDGGLVLRPSNAVITGKMFGYGLYFADRAKKSYGYTSCRGSYWARGGDDKGFMSLYNVHLGNSYITKGGEGWIGSATEKILKSKGPYDSLSALRGNSLYNNEFIVYNESQCCIRYLVEVA